MEFINMQTKDTEIESQVSVVSKDPGMIYLPTCVWFFFDGKCSVLCLHMYFYGIFETSDQSDICKIYSRQNTMFKQIKL